MTIRTDTGVRGYKALMPTNTQVGPEFGVRACMMAAKCCWARDVSPVVRWRSGGWVVLVALQKTEHT